MFLLRMKPNWSSPVTESLQFSTNIFRSGNNRETRESLRRLPKQTFEATYLLRQAEIRRLAAAMTRARDREVLFVVPHMPITLTAARNGFEETFSARTPYWLRPGMFVTFDRSVWEVKSVSKNSFEAEAVPHGIPGFRNDDYNLVTEDGAFNLVTEGGVFNLIGSQVDSQATVAGDKVFLALPGKLDASISLDLETDRVGTARLLFTTSPGAVVDYAQPHTGTTFGDSPTFFPRINWRDGVQVGFETGRVEFSTTSGPLAHEFPSPHTARSWSATCTLKNREEVLDYVGFFALCRGRQGGFNFADPGGTLEIKQAVPGSNELFLEGSENSLGFNSDPLARVIVLERENGRAITRKVAGTFRNIAQDQTRVDLDAALPEDIGNLKAARLLFQSRFAEDTLEVTWLTSSVAEATLAVRTTDYENPPRYNLVVEAGTENLVTELNPENLITEG